VAREGKATDLSFVSKEVLQQVEKLGDFFARFSSLKQMLPALRAIQRRTVNRERYDRYSFSIERIRARF
jgi:hypothetical protein